MWRGVGIGRGIALAHSTYVDGNHVAVAHKRLCLLHVGLQFADPLGAELQLIHELNHFLAYKIGLVTHSHIVKKVVGLLQDDVLQVVATVDLVAAVEVEACVDGAYIDDASKDLIGLVYGEDDIVAASKNNDCDTLLQQLLEGFYHSEVGIAGGGTADEVAEVGEADVCVRFGKTVEIAAYLIGGCRAAAIIDRGTILRNTNQRQLYAVERREASLRCIRRYIVAQHGMELLAVVVHNSHIHRLKIAAYIHSDAC